MLRSWTAEIVFVCCLLLMKIPISQGFLHRTFLGFSSCRQSHFNRRLTAASTTTTTTTMFNTPTRSSARQGAVSEAGTSAPAVVSPPAIRHSRSTRSSVRLQSTVADNEDISPQQPSPPKATNTKKKRAAALKTKGAVTPSPSKKPRTQPPSASKTTTTPKKKKAASKKSKAIEPGSLKPPQGWEEIYQLVEELRADRSAPVDSDGSEALPQTDLGPKVRRFQVLIALMLSSQTKDAVVGETMRALQQHGLTVENISQTSPEQLNQLIGKVGFHNNKTKYIKAAVDILLEKYDGDIPPTAQEMMELPGVGPKMAFIVENVAWDKVTGIGVDTHMHRIFNTLKWVQSKNPEQTRLQLEGWLPRDKWGSINLLWVGFGQEVQQFKPKVLRKVLDCSQPAQALKLVKKLGLDYNKEGEKLGVTDEIKAVLAREKKQP